MEPLTTLFSGLFARIIGDRLQRASSANKLPFSSVKQLSQRINHVVHLASERKRINSTLGYLAETIEGIDLSTLEKIRSGAAEASPELVRRICFLLGASYRYVWYGEDTPFSIDDDGYVPISEYLGLFREPGLDSIYFVRGKSYPHIGFVVLQYDEYRFRVLPHRLHVSAENGNGGTKSLSEFAKLSENYHKTSSYRAIAIGLEVPGSTAEKVLVGDLHPRALLNKESKRSYWWDDLSDISHI
ncbi:MAG: helix-turn-helix domain-containing protein, partial [Bradyrhizobium sp.]